MIMEKTIAPIIAAVIIDKFDEKIPGDINAIATDKFEPDEIPKIVGPARGLLK
jgi:hypothetical protein